MIKLDAALFTPLPVDQSYLIIGTMMATLSFMRHAFALRGCGFGIGIECVGLGILFKIV